MFFRNVELPPNYTLLQINRSYSSSSSIFFYWGEVRLSPLDTSATNWPIVPAPDDR
jgi:hypothetical protein